MSETDRPRSAIPEQTNETWQAFVEATAGREPRELLVRSMEWFSEPGVALDLGCGAGNETMALLEAGWHVTAVDAFDGSIKSTRRKAEHLGLTDRLTTVHASFESISFGSSMFDLIHAGYALPFVAPSAFPIVWGHLRAALQPDGIIACQLFGDRDEWNTDGSTMTFHCHDDVASLFSDFNVLHLQEAELDGQTALGDAKHWHVFHIIGQDISG